MGQTFYGQIESSHSKFSQAVFRPMEKKDVCLAGKIVSAGRAFLKEQGVSQWQKGNYPCAENFAGDVVAGIGYVLEIDGEVAAVCAITDTPELSYAEIDGSWLTEGTKYFTVHRSAVSAGLRGQGIFCRLIEGIAEKAAPEGISSIRIDTHEFNKPMRRALEKSGFTLCGRLTLKEGDEIGDPRLGYEKLV